VTFAWPLARLGDGLSRIVSGRAVSPPSSLEDVPEWIETLATSLGVDASRERLRSQDLERLSRSGETALALVRGAETASAFLFHAGRVLAPDGVFHRVSPGVLREIRRSGMEADSLEDGPEVDVWILGPRPGAPLRELLRRTRLGSFVALFVSAYVADYLLFVLSWWILGRAALSRDFDLEWLALWALLFGAMLPLRMLATWSEGRIAVAAGRLLKRRLLTGAMRLEPDETRAEGIGRQLARVFESEAVESLALGGGLLSAAASIQLVVVLPILLAGAGGVLHAGLLLLALAVFAFVARCAFLERRLWTDERLEMSHHLVERMVGHRTRLVQQRPEEWHLEEEAYLARYFERSRRVDRLQAVLEILPRAFLPLGLAGLAAPFLLGSAPVDRLAVGVGGTILAYRALAKLVFGFSSLLDAAIVWQRVSFLFHAAARNPARGDPALGDATGGALVEMQGVTYRYPGRQAPALREVDLSIERGDRILLQSPSGSGKSTLVSLLNGLRQPASGSLLLDGWSRERLGARRWTRRVATAPQFHENYVFTETFAFNLLMGRRWPPTGQDWKEAEALCRELGLGELLDEMSGGMNQLVGDTGWQLSHGERSRLFLARALLQGGELVLLDESFAALDPENLRKALLTARARARSLLVVGHG
jgi:ATP-binding cassette subfamily B protein